MSVTISIVTVRVVVLCWPCLPVHCAVWLGQVTDCPAWLGQLTTPWVLWVTTQGVTIPYIPFLTTNLLVDGTILHRIVNPF